MSDKLAVARLRVARERPYFSSVLWAFQPVPVADMAKQAPGPMGVDRHLRLYYDPVVIETWNDATLAAVLVHEIGHVLRAHATRRGERDFLAWNVAGDLEINDDLIEEKLPLPKDCVTPKTFKLPDGLMAEEYYDRLPRISISATGGVTQGQCGSVADGQAHGYELPANGTEKVPAGVSEAEQELIRQRVAQDIESHAKQRGTVPGWLERWAKDRLKSKVDWRRLLAAFIRRAVGDARGAVDYTYSRPGRRSGALPQFVWPALRQPTPQIAVVVDTSGSMSDKELSQALAEIEGVLSSNGNRSGITVLSCDAAVHTTQKIFKTADVKLAGGGGTSMTVGLRAAEAIKPKPHVIILVTDCETDWPDRMSTPLIVARTSTGSPAPAWAKVVDVKPD